MVDIPDDEDLVDYDGNDEEPEEELEQQIGHGNQFAQHPNPQPMIEDLSTRLGNLEYRHGVLMRKMKEVSDAEVADSIAIGEIYTRVAVVREQVQVMESQAVQVVSRVDTYTSGQMAVLGQDEIVGLSQQSYMLWMEERLTVLEKRLPGPPPGPQ
nr:hypothetical protein [Tanacetum cinerariifolium]